MSCKAEIFSHLTNDDGLWRDLFCNADQWPDKHVSPTKHQTTARRSTLFNIYTMSERCWKFDPLYGEFNGVFHQSQSGSQHCLLFKGTERKRESTICDLICVSSSTILYFLMHKYTISLLTPFISPSLVAQICLIPLCSHSTTSPSVYLYPFFYAGRVTCQHTLPQQRNSFQSLAPGLIGLRWGGSAVIMW